MAGVVTVRYWAGARAAAGLAEETFEAGTVGDLLRAVSDRRNLGRILAASSLLVDGTAVHSEPADRSLPAGAVVDILPPFAGG